MKTYFGDWASYDDMIRDFGAPAPDVRPAEVLFASYSDHGYTGDALVLFARDGRLYEVAAAHCSCRGLEDQWAPEEVTWAALAMRPRPPDCHLLGDGHVAEAVAAFWALVDVHPIRRKRP